MSDITFTSGTTVTSDWLNFINDRANEYVSIEDFGGGVGGTDNLAPFNAAIADGATIIKFPKTGTYYFSAGIVVPSGVSLIGGSFLPGNPPTGTVLEFALGTSTCIQLDGESNNGNASVCNLSITRSTGTIPDGSIGIQLYGTYATNVIDVGIYGHAIPIQLQAVGSSYGIAAMFTRVYTGAAKDTHVEINGWPEARFSQCRFGNNGSGDLNCNSFFKITGGNLTNAAGGPNTVVATNCQFNQGQNTVAAWLDFSNQLPSSVSDATLWQFDSCYIETCDTGIQSDATWTSITRLLLNNIVFNRSVGIPFLSLNAATGLDSWVIDNSLIYGDLTLAPTPQVNFLHINNTTFLGPVSITGNTSGSTASVSDCNFADDLTLAGTWGSLQVRGGAVSSGTLTNTATSSSGGIFVDIFPQNAWTTFTPALSFGGGTTGITYTTQSGVYREVGGVVEGQLSIVLTSKGSDTGIAQITLTGLPEVSGSSYSLGNSGSAGYTLNMSSLSGHVIGIVGSGPILNLYHSDTTGITSVLNTNFNNTTTCNISFRYLT